MVLFRTKDNHNITEKDFINALEKLNVHKAKCLYIHSDISFGLPNIELLY